MAPLITLITVNYNNLIGLERTFKSVVKQSFKDFEYLVIDGNSSDGAKEFLEQNSQSLSYWISEPDKGIYNAMNKGIAKAKGNYILFLNSGDVFYSDDSLQKFVPFCSNSTSADIIYGNLFVRGNTEFVNEYPDTLSFDYFFKNTLPHPATLIKRSCFEVLIFDEQLKIISDWKFFVLGICKYNFTYLKINAIISIFYLDGISSNQPKLIELEKNLVLETEFPLFVKDYNKLTELKQDYHLAKNSFRHIFKNLTSKILRKMR
jgi:glycosyltransferase involved in cell wall biosynthesis